MSLIDLVNVVVSDSAGNKSVYSETFVTTAADITAPVPGGDEGSTIRTEPPGPDSVRKPQNLELFEQQQNCRKTILVLSKTCTFDHTYAPAISKQTV